MRGNSPKQASSLLAIKSWQEVISVLDKPEKLNIIPVRERHIQHGVKRADIPYCREDFETEEINSSPSDAERIQAPQAEVMYGSVGDAIDELSSTDRILYESQEFIVTGGFRPILFRMKDEIGALKATIKKPNTQGKLVPVAFQEPGAGGIDLDAIGPFDPKTDLANMIGQYDTAEWSELKKDKRSNEHQEYSWQAHAPALLTYLTDIIPDYPLEAVSPILLEPEGQIAQILIPEDEVRIVMLLLGEANMVIVNNGNISKSHLFVEQKTIEVRGPCHVILEATDDAYDDTLLVIGKPIVDPDRTSPADDAFSRIIQLSTKSVDIQNIPSSFDYTIGEENLDDDEDDCMSEDEREAPERFDSIFSKTSGVLPDINDLGKDIPTDLDEQVKLWAKETSGTIPLEEWRIRKKLKCLDNELTTRMDSIYVGKGYVPPMLRWEKILEEEPSQAAEAAERRAEIAKSLHRTAKKISTLTKMGEFRERLYKLNQADKALVNLWNPKGVDAAKDRFKQYLSSEHVIRARCNICGQTFSCSPKYEVYAAAYKYALGHEEAEIKAKIETANERKNHEQVEKLTKELDNLSIVHRPQIKCWRKHNIEALKLAGKNAYTVLQNDPLTSVQSLCRKGKNGGPLIENLVAKAMWHWFDRRRNTTPAQIKFRLKCTKCNTVHDRVCSKEERKKAACPACKKTGILQTLKFTQVAKSEFHDDSRWWKDRTEALKNLNATQAQWNTIYKQLWIQENRMQQCYLAQDVKKDKAPLHIRREEWQRDRDMAWDALKSAFRICNTLQDLNTFEEGALHQTIADQSNSIDKKAPQAGEIIQLSAFDRLTFGDEQRIKLAIERKRISIKADIKTSFLLGSRGKTTLVPCITCTNADSCEIECLGKDCIEAWCYKCNTPSTGIPKFDITEEDKGFLYITCSNDSCGEKIAIGAINGPRTIRQICPKNKD